MVFFLQWYRQAFPAGFFTLVLSEQELQRPDQVLGVDAADGDDMEAVPIPTGHAAAAGRDAVDRRLIHRNLECGDGRDPAHLRQSQQLTILEREWLRPHEP